MYTLFGDPRSGNCYKAALLLRHLGLPFQWEFVDILAGEAKTSGFLAKNPAGKVPTLALPEGGFLAESNAILNYLAEGTEWLPGDRLARAQVLSWQFWEQYSHEPFIAVVRFIKLYQNMPEERRAEYLTKLEGGYAALGVMEGHLAEREYFVGTAPTLADLSLFAYTHVAHEGGMQLGDYPRVRAWISRFESLPGHVPMGEA